MPVYRLDWTSPPLTENQRWSHWAAKGRVVKDVRLTGKLLAARLGRQERVEVTLTWIVPNDRKRDEDNVVPTLKALCDGLVDAGVVPDDTRRYMVKNMPVIRVERGCVPRMELEVTPLT
jgi:crossover junction endodeoxyribonuclease RusA